MIVLNPGEFITTLRAIEFEAGMGVTRQNVRTAVKRFARLGFLTCESASGSHKITIQNWETYQHDKPKTTKTVPVNRFIKPTPQEVAEYAVSIGFQLDGGSFCDFYESKGWKVGKTPMKDWKAAVRTWKKSSHVKPAPAKCLYCKKPGDHKKVTVTGKTVPVRVCEACMRAGRHRA